MLAGLTLTKAAVAIGADPTDLRSRIDGGWTHHVAVPGPQARTDH